MATSNSTQALDFLGRTVHLIHHVELGNSVQDFDCQGQVIAVVVPLPGAPVGTSILIDLPMGPEYVDLDDCTLLSVA